MMVVFVSGWISNQKEVLNYYQSEKYEMCYIYIEISYGFFLIERNQRNFVSKMCLLRVKNVENNYYILL